MLGSKQALIDHMDGAISDLDGVSITVQVGGISCAVLFLCCGGCTLFFIGKLGLQLLPEKLRGPDSEEDALLSN